MPLPELFRRLLEAVPDGIVVSDTSGAIVHATTAFEELSAYRLDELQGMTVEELVPERLRDVHVGHREHYYEADLPSRPMGRGLEIVLRRGDGSVIPVDIALSTTEADGERFVLAAVRDVSEPRRGEARLRALNEVAQAILTGGTSDQLLHQVAASASRLVGAEAALVLVSMGDGQFAVRAADGAGVDDVRGVVFVSHGMIDEAVRTGRSALLADLSTDGRCAPEVTDAIGLGPGLVLPVWVRGEPFGVLVVARRRGSSLFEHRDLVEEETYAAQAAVAIEYARARDELQRMTLLEDRERIARELHDTVIQRLFAAGMTLQATVPDDGSATAQRVNGVIDELDKVIAEIRSTIFALEPATRAGGVRARVMGVVTDLAPNLGFRPQVRFSGPVDSAVSSQVGGHLTSVVREALSNMARHAHASSAAVNVVVGNGEVLLEVTDDGVGIDDDGGSGAGGGMGLRNLADRAQQLGGSFEVASWAGRGTTLTWRVPAAGEA